MTGIRAQLGFLSVATWMFLGALGCAAEVASDDADSIGSTAAPLAESDPVPAEVLDCLRSNRRLTSAQLDRVYHLDHYVRVGHGRRVHVTEAFTLRSWLSWPHRASLVLPGYPGNADFYNLDVDGYRFQDTLAGEGHFAFVAEYEGTGQSTYPENGLDLTHDRAVETMRKIVAFIRLARLVPKVDLIGASNGGAIATELCADSRAVRSCILSSMLYTEGTPFFYAVFQDPALLGFFASQPNGYVDVTPDLFFNILARTNPEVTAAILATQPGIYAVQPFLEFADIPYFDPTRAKVPGLIIQGTEDNVATQADADLLAAAYGSVGGGTATVVRIEGAGHIPNIEPAPINDQFTAAVLDFLDAP